MKNLLIDALRQAGSDAEPSAGERPHGPSERETAAPLPEGGVGDDKDFELVESTVLPDAMSPLCPEADDAAAEQSSDTIDHPIDDPTLLLPALKPDEAPAVTAPPLAPGRPEPRRDPLLTLGRWSPALCLIALSAAAGGFVAYQRMAAQSAELGVLPTTQPGRDVLAADQRSKWRPLADTESQAGQAAPPPMAGIRSYAPKTEAESGRRAERPRANLELRQSDPDSIDDPAFADVHAGFDAYTNGDLDGAEARYRSALAIDPNHRYALAGLGAVLQRTSRVDESMPLYERLLALDPDDTRAAAALLAHARRDDAPDNGTRLKVLIQRHPEAPALHFALGVMMAEAERWPEAHAAFIEAHALMPANADYSYNAAVSAAHLGQLDTARRYYQQALATATPDSLVDPRAITEQLALLTAGRDESS